MLNQRCFVRCVFVLIIFTGISWAGGLNLYVDPAGDDKAEGSAEKPIATIGRAISMARQVKDKPVTVLLKGGEYVMTRPLEFTVEDGRDAENSLTFKAAEGQQPIISGGKRISGWKKGENGIWTTQIDEVKAGDWWFTQLFVNGQRKQRAKIPNEGFLRVAGFPDGGKEVHYHTDCQRFQYAEGDINPNWTNLDDVEVIVYHFWTDSHLPIESVDTEKRIVTFKHKAGKVFTDDFKAEGARYIIENVYEGLDAPGQWYLNRKTGVLSYIPLESENMETARVIAPVAPAMMHIKGDAMSQRFVEHIRFEGIEFAYTNWFLPAGNSNDNQGSSSVPAAITLEGARHITFNRCRFANLGTFAFEVGSGCQYNRFTHNQIENAAAGAFRVNGGNEHSHPLMRTGYNTISDNVIGPYGEVYPSAVGVLLMHTNGNTVSHNEIHHGWYTGISIGWHWGYQRSISRDNIIEYNHIHDIGQGLLSDMGAIYTLGVSPGTVIRNNLIHTIESHHYGGWGIYNDEGSSHILVENNIVYRTKFAGYNIHYAKEITVRNNIFAFGRLQQLSRGRVEPHMSFFFENNIVYFTEGVLLDNSWQDQEYTFHFNPNYEGGVRKVSNTFDMDWNMYYNPKKPVEEVRFHNGSFEQWKQRGKDRHSVYADPMFVDAEKYDFRLRKQSPAYGLGFKPIDMSTVGPRK